MRVSLAGCDERDILYGACDMMMMQLYEVWCFLQLMLLLEWMVHWLLLSLEEMVHWFLLHLCPSCSHWQGVIHRAGSMCHAHGNLLYLCLSAWYIQRQQVSTAIHTLFQIYQHITNSFKLVHAADKDFIFSTLPCYRRCHAHSLNSLQLPLITSRTVFYFVAVDCSPGHYVKLLAYVYYLCVCLVFFHASFVALCVDCNHIRFDFSHACIMLIFCIKINTFRNFVWILTVFYILNCFFFFSVTVIHLMKNSRKTKMETTGSINTFCWRHIYL